MQRVRLSTIVIASLLLCWQSVSARTLTIGSISKSPSEEIAVFFPLADYLARQLAGSGIDKGKVVVVNSIAEMAEQLKTGQIDIYIDSPFPSLAVSRLTDSKIILRRWKGGKVEYRSMIIVRTDSPIRTLADLRGKIIAFEDDYSTSGYFLPKSALLRAGLKVRPCEETVGAAPADELSCIFARVQSNARIWVLRGKVHAAAMGAHNMEGLLPQEREQIRIMHETVAVPRQVVSVRQELDATLMQRIREVLMAMERSEEGRAVLEKFQNTTRFDEFPDGPEQALAPIRELLEDTHAEIGRR